MLSEIPYRADSTVYFGPLAERAWAVFLDSGRPLTGAGRYDILAADPYITLTTRGDVTEIRHADQVQLSPHDPFALLRGQLGEPVPPVPDLPFRGGAIGWFAYDLGRRIERLPTLAENAEQLPDMAVGIYDWALVVDHLAHKARLVSLGRDPRTRERWDTLLSMFRDPRLAPARSRLRVLGPPRSNLTRDEYGLAFDRIKSYLLEGDCYQVNLAQRFSAPVAGDPFAGNLFAGYRALRRLNPAPFSAYLKTPFAQVLSSSPERFLAVRDGQVETRPVKGTRPRGRTPAADSALQRELAASTKERAENLMIVDLLRNDLGRVCSPGSVRVPKLFEVESYATVHHLVSTVTGRLAPGQDAVSLLRACFPGGSITGAPKIRAMEIIEELEPHRRGVYSGAIGYLGCDGAMDTNIAIRTLIHSASTIRFWAGGGIVHDSQVEEEYRETLDKTTALLRLLEHEQLTGGGG
ncbi:aminodeoxychorismate synthase component I [Candidatus Thiosymbion oneisti]|uniref:aminodeoxychorismate synthase component I n=1 Tax=Candidatus Thiosymbion oneisti TaxID=589554 RepID=UPI000AAA72AB|nr:aminodeoxychorismate synthase component I [Candidatus Thiosymbion oneisti]